MGLFRELLVGAAAATPRPEDLPQRPPSDAASTWLLQRPPLAVREAASITAEPLSSMHRKRAAQQQHRSYFNRGHDEDDDDDHTVTPKEALQTARGAFGVSLVAFLS